MTAGWVKCTRTDSTDTCPLNSVRIAGEVVEFNDDGVAGPLKATIAEELLSREDMEEYSASDDSESDESTSEDDPEEGEQ